MMVFEVPSMMLAWISVLPSQFELELTWPMPPKTWKLPA